MRKKLGVQFRKSPKTAHAFERLRYCKHCESYTALWHEECDVCGRENSFLTLRQLAHILTRRHLQKQLLIVGLLICLAILSADTIWQLVAAVGGGIVSMVLYFLMQRKFVSYERNHYFMHLVSKEQSKIKNGLSRNLTEVNEDIEAERFKDAYEKIREVGYLLYADAVKICKIMLLNHFVLRKDMELELESLIPSFYDKNFVEYLGEVLKVKPWLLKKAVIEYVIRFRGHIILEENGPRVIGLTAGAALRMKSYVVRYQEFIRESLEYMPRERLLRLVRLLQAHPDENWPELREAASRLIETRYSFDPDFKGIL
ncbi:hypothetical protein NDK47_26325 [Brevibacillus ruminantium]|uniref:Uncharacterized protein n=1 Tax=Brevibacillus ruminantium TaxID=2950604 RepID=A0ABY4WFB6_9BACL|nr:hypothetical protein [Brevibacillus ruminantium]USG65574.1 hypothetical protein NDK47_26325 [Brevibacillus ruminantium]